MADPPVVPPLPVSDLTFAGEGEMALRGRRLPLGDHGARPPPGYGQDKDRDRSRRAGFERHLVKPLDLRSIEQAIEGAAE